MCQKLLQLANVSWSYSKNNTGTVFLRDGVDGINSRFGTVFDDTKVQLASAVHPKFKLDWLENQVQKSLVVEQLKRAVAIEHRSKETH